MAKRIVNKAERNAERYDASNFIARLLYNIKNMT